MSENSSNSFAPAPVGALLLGTATIAGAWFFELVLGLAPCPMCLIQRWPYYIGLPILLVGLVMIKKGNRNTAIICILTTAALFVAGGFYAGFHSGVEWRLWEGPAGCSGGEDLSGSVGNLLQDLKTATVVSCVDAAWRFLGISLAGYNVIVSAIIAALCVITFVRLKERTRTDI